MFMSGYMGGDMLILNYGWTFIQKPFFPVKLVTMVNRVLHTPNKSQGAHVTILALRGPLPSEVASPPLCDVQTPGMSGPDLGSLLNEDAPQCGHSRTEMPLGGETR